MKKTLFGAVLVVVLAIMIAVAGSLGYYFGYSHGLTNINSFKLSQIANASVPASSDPFRILSHFTAMNPQATCP